MNIIILFQDCNVGDVDDLGSESIPDIRGNEDFKAGYSVSFVLFCFFLCFICFVLGWICGS